MSGFDQEPLPSHILLMGLVRRTWAIANQITASKLTINQAAFCNFGLLCNPVRRPCLFSIDGKFSSVLEIIACLFCPVKTFVFVN